MDDREKVKTGWMMKSAYIITSLLLLAVIVFYIFATPIVEAFLKEYLNSSTKNKYTLNYDKFAYNPVLGTVSVRNLRLSLNPSIYTQGEMNETSNISMEELELGGINPLEILFRKKVHLSRVHFLRPVIEIISKKNEEEESSRSSIKDFLSSDVMNALRADEINIDDGTLNVHKINLKNNFIEVLGFGANIRNLGSYEYRGEKKLGADLIELSAKKYRMNLSRFYYVEVDDISINSLDSSIRIGRIRNIPRYGIMQYASEKNIETDRIDLTLSGIAVDGINILNMLNDKMIYADKITVDKLNMLDTRIVDYPKDTSPGTYSPLQVTEDFKYRLKISRLVLKDGKINYSEIHRADQSGGKVMFDHLKLNFNNLTNIGFSEKSRQKATITGSMEVYGQGLLRFVVDMPLRPNSSYYIKGNLGRFDLTLVNNFVVNAELFKIDKGVVRSSDFSFTVSPANAYGSVVVSYDDLYIKKLDEDKEDGSKSTDLISTFILNNFILEGKNPRNGKLAKGEISYTKDPAQNITSYWWKSLRSGIMKIAGLK